jgi:hypothetical protein
MKISIYVAGTVLIFASCENVQHRPAAAVPPPRTTTSLATERIRPRVIRIVKDTGFEEEEQNAPPSLTARARGETAPDAFAGVARKAAKISIATADVENEDLAALIVWCRAHETPMRHHQPPISAAASSARIPEEARNVSVEGWIHFAKEESDHDYHLIIGTSPDLAGASLMNAEISGLPPRSSRSFDDLKNARESFESICRDMLPQMRRSGYAQITPVHVHLTGSLFYDIDHAAGAVGPAGHRAKSAWEIHPITAIDPLD